MFNCSVCWDNPCTCCYNYKNMTEEGLKAQIKALAKLLAAKRTAAGKSNVMTNSVAFKSGMTVEELFEAVVTWPTHDSDGEKTEVWVGGTNGLSNQVIQVKPLNVRKADGNIPCSADLYLEIAHKSKS